MRKKFWICLALLLVIPGLLFTVSCTKKTVKSEASMTKAGPEEAKAAAEKEELARQKEMDRQKELARQRAVANVEPLVITLNCVPAGAARDPAPPTQPADEPPEPAPERQGRPVD